MTQSVENKLMVIIAGPTGVGKTSTAIKLAQHYKTEIISADSRQFYKGPKIGTASPTAAELSAISHHFIANLNLDEYYNVAKFEKDALELSLKLFENHKVVFIVGGSGLYINALCHSIDDLPDADEILRQNLNTEFEKKGLKWLQDEVEHFDPTYFQQVDKKNPKRLLRALEVIKATGKTYSQQRKSTKKQRPFKILKIALNLERAELFERINSRVDSMMENGLLAEAKEYYQYRNLNSLNTVGYKELFSFFDSNISLSRAIEDIKTNTRRYAKRQITWFKKDLDFQWFSPYDHEKIIQLIDSKFDENF
ncbi:MAG: tRNA (adenosine(37)-N6)-dimethylallyltransferase MiaA [Bacteroidetes bacterium CG2_30_33_31]|nr:MAG: tRNA (adenosine(37)-N6)-dimethylallyltransferase MiaA [Bacteroidetes bacterium CG2_30_33_31]